MTAEDQSETHEYDLLNRRTQTVTSAKKIMIHRFDEMGHETYYVENDLDDSTQARAVSKKFDGWGQMVAELNPRANAIAQSGAMKSLAVGNSFTSIVMMDYCFPTSTPWDIERSIIIIIDDSYVLQSIHSVLSQNKFTMHLMVVPWRRGVMLTFILRRNYQRWPAVFIRRLF